MRPSRAGVVGAVATAGHNATHRKRMKKILAALSITMLAFAASAQFITGAFGPSLITNTSTLAIAPAAGGSPATNFSLAQCPFVTVGQNGFGVGIKSFGTNAALTTNTWITLEFTGDGVNAITNNNVVVVLLPRPALRRCRHLSKLVEVYPSIPPSCADCSQFPWHHAALASP